MKALKAMQPRHYHTFKYKEDPMQVVHIFKHDDLRSCLLFVIRVITDCCKVEAKGLGNALIFPPPILRTEQSPSMG